MEPKNNRERVLALIQAGNATRESIKDAMGIKSTTLASAMCQLRMMGYYPMEDPDTRVLYVVDKETYESRTTVVHGTRKTPEQKAETLVNTTLRADKAYASAKRRHHKTNNPDTTDTTLALQAALASLKLARYRAASNEIANAILADYFETSDLD